MVGAHSATAGGRELKQRFLAALLLLLLLRVRFAREEVENENGPEVQFAEMEVLLRFCRSFGSIQIANSKWGMKL